MMIIAKKTRHSHLRGNDEFLGRMDKSGSIIAFPTSFLIFLLSLPVALPGLLRLSPVLRHVFLPPHSWRLLLTLCALLLLLLIVHCRASLLRSSLGRG